MCTNPQAAQYRTLPRLSARQLPAAKIASICLAAFWRNLRTTLCVEFLQVCAKNSRPPFSQDRPVQSVHVLEPRQQVVPPGNQGQRCSTPERGKAYLPRQR